MTAREAKKASVRGFGFRETDANGYHFEVEHDASGCVRLTERFSSKKMDEPLFHATSRPKGELSARRWDQVKAVVAEEFNHRLKQDGLPVGRWMKSVTPLSPSLGKELAVLLWAIDDQDVTVIPRMLANWRGLAPEERWWFYTTINAGYRPSLSPPTTGWLAAIKIAFLADPQDVGLEGIRMSETKAIVDYRAADGPKQGRLFSEPDAPDYES